MCIYAVYTLQMYMPKKKLKTKAILLKLNEEDYQRIVLQAGKYKTLTEVITDNIRGGYYSRFKTNDVIDTSIPSNREVVKQLQKESENKPAINEAEELERLKALRKAKKEGDFNA